MAKFYDAHFHMMNLNHPDFSVFITRALKELSFIDRIKMSIAAFPVVGPAIISLLNLEKRPLNLLGIMETEIGDGFVQIEEDLSKNVQWGNGPLLFDQQTRIQYDKIVLTPLMMDFGLKGYNESQQLYQVRWKPIVSQILDICLGIKHYYQYRDHYPLDGEQKTPALFEIYPFLGINTKNYYMEKGPDNDGRSVSLEKLLEKYFSGFAGDTAQTRYSTLAARNWRNFTGDIETIQPYDFIGIKLYPPLGYNPWPTESWEQYASHEMDKVNYFYSFCETNNIPVTSHCSPGGFIVDDKYIELANPNKWINVLKQYPELRLNLAHFGGVQSNEWRKAIAKLILENKHVYTDIAYRGVDKNSYMELGNFLKGYTSQDRERLLKHIIFGSDFMINLMNIDSYGNYMKYFAETPALTLQEKDLMCSKNTEAFLFLNPELQ